MALSIIIPARDEPLLWFTIQRLKETRGKMPLEIIVMDDGSQTKYDLPDSEKDCVIRMFRREDSQGTNGSRDAGILHANNEACLAIDAHCNFWGELNPWPEILVNHAHDYPQDFGCCVCVALEGPDRCDMHGYWFNDNGKRRFRQHDRCYGAHTRLKDHDGTFNRIFCEKWNNNSDLRHSVFHGITHEVGCPLGGAYLINREWYLDGLKRPWRGLRGWGSDEISLALPNWLMGGRNVLLPVEIGHVFRTCSPYTLEHWELIYNQLRLLAVLPLTEDMRMDLLEHLRENTWSPTMWEQTQAELRADLVWLRYRDMLSAAPRTFEQWQQEWICA
jgi:hypothetical protein